MQRIVKLGPDRAHDLAVLNKQLIEDEGHANPMDIEQLSDRMAIWLETGYSCSAIEEDGEIICYGLWRDDGEFYYLRHLFTQRSSRRMGYARELLIYLENNVLIDKSIRLEVLSGNEVALKFYESLGCEPYALTLLKPVNKSKNLAPAASATSAEKVMGVVALDHIQIAMPKGREQEAREFYQDILGISEVPKPAGLSGRGGAWFENSQIKIHLGVEDDFRPAKKAHPGLLVSNLDQLLATLTSRGYAVTDDRNLSSVKRAFTHDPFGNRIELIQYDSSKST